VKHAVELGSGAMAYVPSLLKIGSGIQKLLKGDTETHMQHGDCVSLLLLLQNKGNRLKH
jgi:hypothetical protein